MVPTVETAIFVALAASAVAGSPARWGEEFSKDHERLTEWQASDSVSWDKGVCDGQGDAHCTRGNLRRQYT